MDTPKTPSLQQMTTEYSRKRGIFRIIRGFTDLCNLMTVSVLYKLEVI